MQNKTLFVFLQNDLSNKNKKLELRVFYCHNIVQFLQLKQERLVLLYYFW